MIVSFSKLQILFTISTKNNVFLCNQCRYFQIETLFAQYCSSLGDISILQRSEKCTMPTSTFLKNFAINTLNFTKFSFKFALNRFCQIFKNFLNFFLNFLKFCKNFIQFFFKKFSNENVQFYIIYHF